MYYFILLVCVKPCLSSAPIGNGGSLWEFVICILLNINPTVSVIGPRHAIGNKTLILLKIKLKEI